MKEIRINVATLALGASALIALGAVGVAVLRSGDGSTAPSKSAAAASDGDVQQEPNPEAMIAEARERLRQDPDNDQGWFNLGVLLRGTERFPEAAQAFRRAMELRPQNADYVAYLGEALLLQSEGNPPPEAERLFRHALELDRTSPQARFYLATIRDVRGDHRGAIDDLLALLGDAPAGAPWEEQVRGAVTRIAQANRIDIANRLPAPPRSTATAAIPGPTREQMEAARGIPPSQQNEMVRGMVDRLAARLRQNPRDADGWIMLMRSRMTLNQPQEATAALRSALAAFSSDAASQQRLRTAAEELGVPAG
jgi:cytochrome c-type biogenesis protein CcmH